MAVLFINHAILWQAIKPTTKQNETEQNKTKPEAVSELTGESFEHSPTSNCSSAMRPTSMEQALGHSPKTRARKHHKHEPSQ